MISVFVYTACALCFVCGMIVGIEIGSRETLKQLDKDTDF